MPSRAEYLLGGPVKITPAEGEAVLRRTGWLSDRETEFQDALLSICHWRHFQPGESLVTAGDTAAPLVGIASGTAAVITALGPPDTPLTHVGHPGLWVGFVPLVAGRPADNSTVARTPVYAAVIAKSAVEALLKANPPWWRHFARLALIYGELAVSTVADLLIRESDRRCAATLLRIANCRFKGAQRVIAQVNQSDLAVIANLSRGTANSLLREFEAKDYLVRQYNHIDILNPRALRALADGE
jgi:CRP-like cAMP-binding protein